MCIAPEMARTPLANAVRAAAAAERPTTRRRSSSRPALPRSDSPRSAGSPRPARRHRAQDRRRRGGLAGLSAAHLGNAVPRGGTMRRAASARRRTPEARSPTADRRASGELIDQSHSAIRQLPSSTPLDNLRAEQNVPSACFGGWPTTTPMNDDIKAAWQKIQHLPPRATRRPSSPDARGRQLDNMSIVDWINETFVGGMSSRLQPSTSPQHRVRRRVLAAEFEPALPAGYRGQGQFRVYGESNEKYHVVGGTTRSPDRLADRLAGQITTARAHRREAKPSRELHLDLPAGLRDEECDRGQGRPRTPFSILRLRRSLEGGVRAVLSIAIRELGRARTRSPRAVFCRFWRAQGLNGETFRHRLPEHLRCPARRPARVGSSSTTRRTVGASFAPHAGLRGRQFLVRRVRAPGAKNVERRAAVDFWPGYQWTKGSYCTGRWGSTSGSRAWRAGGRATASRRRATSIDFRAI